MSDGAVETNNRGLNQVSSHRDVAICTDQAILSARGAKNLVDPRRPYHTLVEPEFISTSVNREGTSVAGKVEDVATIFLTNRECPFRCLMCDLWINTLDHRVSSGAIITQIKSALETLPKTRHIKLYNSGNFFDTQAIPSEDLPSIAKLVAGFRSVIVENHPRLCHDRVIEFRDLTGTVLEVAMGLETSHAPTLQRLNKQMTLSDFSRACRFLKRHGLRVRAFILVRPPWTSQQEGIERAIASVEFAFDCGVDCCAVIPTRSGNGIMDQLQQRGEFAPPQLSALEAVLRETLSWHAGIVIADLWDADRFAQCKRCAEARIERLRTMNLTQSIPSDIACADCGGSGAERDA